MTSFKISAPGKVILFGEHAVVYGKTAVAASLNNRTFFEFHELSPDENYIHLELLKLAISRKVSLSQVQDFFSKILNLDEDHDIIFEKIREFVNIIGFDGSRQKIGLECFFYALFQVAQKENLVLRPFKVKLDTELSIGAGLGSSASFSVCLNAGFLRWSQLQKEPNMSSNFSSTNLNTICAYSFNCEKIMHGKPSGIDNSICTFGSLIEFRKNEAPKFIDLGSKSMKILLVDTKVERSTKQLVEKLANLLVKYPEIYQRVLASIDVISKRVIKIVKQLQDYVDDEDSQILKAYEELSLLIDINQGLLATCQVSHYSLDLICLVAKKFGFSAKLTGAGGGGFAYVLIPPDADDISVQKLSSELTSSGFSVTETTLGGSGVIIHDIVSNGEC